MAEEKRHIRYLKRVRKVFVYFTGILLLLLVVGYVFFRSASAQTWLTHRITSYLENKLNTKINIAGVDIEWPTKIVLEGVFIQDLHKDTLAYIGKLKVNPTRLEFDSSFFYTDLIILQNTTAKIKRYKGEEDFNFQFLADAFSSGKKSTSSKAIKMQINTIELDNVHFIYRDEPNIEPMRGMNYWDLDVKNISGVFDNVKFENDTIYAQIKSMAAHEKCGFSLKDFSGKTTLSSTDLLINDLRVKTDESDISGVLNFNYNQYDNYNDFIDSVTMHCLFDRSVVQMNDIAYFAPDLKGLHQKVKVSGKVDGTVVDLKCKKINLSLFDSTSIAGNFSFKGLPDIDSTFMYFDLKKVRTTQKDLAMVPIPPFDKNELLELPKDFNFPENIEFAGSFNGFFDDFVALGTVTSSYGMVKADLLLERTNDEKRKYSYKGNVVSNRFNIGKFLSIPSLGAISLNAEVTGRGLKRDNVQANLKGKINALEFNGYSYQNADVSGFLEKRLFSGNLKIYDNNINLDFSGDIDFKTEVTHLNFDTKIKQANLYALNLVTDSMAGELSMNALVDISGNRLEDMVGKLRLSDMQYDYIKGSVRSDYFTVTSVKNNNNRIVDIKSDLVDANINGEFRFSDLGAGIISTCSYFLPNLASAQKKNIAKHNYFFSIRLKDPNGVLKIFYPNLFIAKNTNITGFLDREKHSLDLRVESNKFGIDKYTFSNIRTYVNNRGRTLDLNASLSGLKVSDSLELSNLVVRTIADSTNQISNSVTWYFNNEPEQSNINVNAVLKSSSSFSLKINPSAVHINHRFWNITQPVGSLFDSSYINIGEVNIVSGSQSIKISGEVSAQQSHKALIDVEKFELSTLNYLLQSSNVALKGVVSGKTTVAGLYKRPIVESGLTITDFYFNNEFLGKGEVKSEWETQNDWISMSGFLSKGIVNNVEFDGKYFPQRKGDNIDFKATLNAMKLQVFEPYAYEYCSDLKGQFSGSVEIKGTPEQPLITGVLSVQAKKIKVNYLNTVYHFDGTFTIEPGSFGVENLKVIDENLESALVTGKLYHDNFKNFQLDFDINAKRFMCLNTTESLNNLYYGKANVTGYINFFGYLDKILIDAAVKTEKGTRLNIPLSGTSEVGSSDFITFVKKDSAKVDLSKNYKVNLNGIQLHFNINMTPDAEVQLIFDSKVGDVIRGRGEGLITLDVNTLGTFNMFGDYTITSGDYLFTLKNIINKKFDIQNGSTIKWAGDPYEADIDITAIYSQKASISPFFPNDTLVDYYKKRHPVNSILYLKNRLMSPDISFDIDFPTLNTNTKQEIKSYLSTEQEMNQQVFALLVLKSFVTPSQLAGLGGVSASATSAAGKNSFELLSNQVSNMFSQVVKEVDVGLNYRPGDNISSDELEIALSRQLLNDRVSIDGNFGIGGNSVTKQNQSNFAGDVNIEYRVTRDGKLRVKAFNKANDNTLLSNTTAPYSQGAGISYKEEFNTLAELYRRYKEKLKNMK